VVIDEVDSSLRADYDTRLLGSLDKMRAEMEEQMSQARSDTEAFYERKVQLCLLAHMSVCVLTRVLEIISARRRGL